ncbi:putative glutamine ABC transporter permease protein GlnM [Hartmannibacter diazotrophicus]|uniref:Putative glutamine ABC transporter permease protein GlnM n=1 Tax=Hartmannibacter diazotrophicus TaxID=1482074 RepID=A0A2C9D7Z5_9HYPH|nr:amino acid ABC transporter permease [Hartmannibacter diazotrophicus]SON56442.1 putative glutamine ABC transporter permease protein GlnM [Hartmannibacter diazotrophicus]
MSEAGPRPKSALRKRLDQLPWWLVAAVICAVGFAVVIAADADYRTIFHALSAGIGTMLFVTVVAFFGAAALGLAIATAQSSRLRIVREAAIFYVEIMRGVPVLVLLFYIAFVGAPALIAAVNFVIAPLVSAGLMKAVLIRDFDLVWRAILALVLSYAAFLSEVFRAGIAAVGAGQVEAARALGMTRWQTFRLVVMPQAFRTILPPLGNDFVAMIKDSSLVSVLGVQDVTQLGKVYSSSTFLFFETYNVVAFIYLVTTVSLSLGVRALEKKLRRQGDAA